LHKKNGDFKKFVFFSRVHPDKGCQMIVNCAKRLNDLGYKEHFLVDFYGAIDKDYKDFPNIVSDVPNVSYKGFLNVQQNDGYDTLSAYDIMLFPTYWSG
jgi:glycosyltransferase involved in cell wall biosynthesis